MGAATDQTTELRKARQRFLKAWTDVLAAIGVAVEATRSLVQEVDTQAAVVELTARPSVSEQRTMRERVVVLEAQVAELRQISDQVTRPMDRRRSCREDP
jgi:hypothetical protein